MIILGIDPGTAITGFGLISFNNNQPAFLDCGCILTKPDQSLPERLNIISKDLKKVIMSTKPDQIAVEDLFFQKNVKTALAVGHARGVILQTIASLGFEVAEYTPLQIKQATTGYGRAGKKQVQKMVKTILGLSYIPKPDDAADALAVAITHGQNLKFKELGKV